MIIFKRNSTCLSVDQIKDRISRGSYPCIYADICPSGIVVFFGFHYVYRREHFFVSLIHSRPLSGNCCKFLLDVAKKNKIRIIY